MVFRILSSLIYVDEKRRLIQIFPDDVRRLWNKWELRVLVLISLGLQIFLIITGNRRKYIAKRRIRIFIWSAYLLADWIATVSLGLLVDRQGNSSGSGDEDEYGDVKLTAFWAPFLLLHLGGPDTITAYALADNELWLRHLLGLLVQTAGAFYITLLAWEGSLLSFLTIPMLLCGIIKYAERTWVLMSANREHFRDSVLTDKDPGPSYAKFMEEFRLKEAEGYHVEAVQMEEDIEAVTGTPSIQKAVTGSASIQKANYFFETLRFKRLFVDLIFGFRSRDESRSFFEEQDHKMAFEVIEVELGFAYDLFYTKAPVIYTPLGLFFRFLTSFVTLSVLVTFFISVTVRSHTHLLIDVVITYVLLVGAILLEAYAIKSLLSSDWTKLWFDEQSSKPSSFLYRIISWIRIIRSTLKVKRWPNFWSRQHSSEQSSSFRRGVSRKRSTQKEKRWSNSMYQYNLLSLCLNHKSFPFQEVFMFIPWPKRLTRFSRNLKENWENFRHLKQLQVPSELKSFVFKHFKRKSTETKMYSKPLQIWRGPVSLQANSQKFEWVSGVEFDHSILIWHIATDLCYNLDKGKRNKDLNGNEIKQEWDDHMLISKRLADYMLYILVMCPFMLPVGIGMIRFRDTCAEALAFFGERIDKENKLEAYEMLGQVSTKVFPTTVKGDRSKSVLFEGCKLAASLREMDDPPKMWEMVADVWVEMLGYAASQCRGFYHAQQLEKGGELLTHVWLLMAHLGLTEHFQITQGHGRVKLSYD